MSLAPGSQIGPYSVVAKIGEGGMGEVFRAHDARLKRDVALKTLPASAVGDPGRRRRFEREAQLLAALDHPFIARIYGVELDGDEPVIVMELVEGDTLADRLKRGAMPVDEAIATALQLCDGLEAAHERNIVHRDLKPANIKLRPDGTIKILDFGIARALSTDLTVDAANSPTMLGGSTDAGIILGTAAYMSPEQARGRAVDKRADVWAFGCICYEMLAGKATFTGESTTDILADVVKAEPDWTRLPATTPPHLVHVLQRCLQKNPKDRIRDIADVRFEIEHGQRSAGGAANMAAIAPPPSPWRAVAWFAAGAVAAAAIVLTITVPRGTAIEPAGPVRSAIVLPPEMTVALGRGASVALSPDGQLVAFVGRTGGNTQLYLRRMNAFETTALSGTDGAQNPFFSPDGRWIAFFADERLKKVSVDGGAPVMVAEVLNARGETWGADDTIYVTPSNNVGISRVPARGGKLEPYSRTRQGELSHRWATMLPDGKTMLFSVWNDAGWDVARISALRAGASDPTPVVELGGGYPRYVRDAGTRGFLVYARAEGLLAAPFDETSLTMSGQAVPVVDGILTNSSGGAHFDLSPSGTLAYIPGSYAEQERDLLWVSRDGKAIGPPQRIHGLTRTWNLSRDGTRVIRNSGGDVWADELTTKRATRLTSSPQAGNFSGVWSFDGQSVIFARGHSQNVDLVAVDADGTNERRLKSTPGEKTASGVSPDGRWVLYQQPDPVTLSDIWVGDVTGETAPRPFLKTSAQESYGVFSNDGKWVAYQSNESGRFEVFVRSFPDGDRVVRVSGDSGVEPVWSPTGTELFYRSFSGRIMAVPVRGGTTFEAGKPQALFDARGYENRFAVAPDAKSFLVMTLIAAEQSSTQINVVQNFLTELRQRVR